MGELGEVAVIAGFAGQLVQNQLCRQQLRRDVLLVGSEQVVDVHWVGKQHVLHGVGDVGDVAVQDRGRGSEHGFIGIVVWGEEEKSVWNGVRRRVGALVLFDRLFGTTVWEIAESGKMNVYVDGWQKNCDAQRNFGRRGMEVETSAEVYEKR